MNRTIFIFLVVLGLSLIFLILYLPNIFYTAVLVIEKLDQEPEHYFVLTEDDLKKYPALRDALERLRGSKEKYILYEVPKQEGYAIFDYLSKRQKEVGNPSSFCSAQFMFKGEFYCFYLMT